MDKYYLQNGLGLLESEDFSCIRYNFFLLSKKKQDGIGGSDRYLKHQVLCCQIIKEFNEKKKYVLKQIKYYNGQIIVIEQVWTFKKRKFFWFYGQILFGIEKMMMEWKNYIKNQELYRRIIKQWNDEKKDVLKQRKCKNEQILAREYVQTFGK